MSFLASRGPCRLPPALPTRTGRFYLSIRGFAVRYSWGFPLCLASLIALLRGKQLAKGRYALLSTAEASR